MTSRQPLYVRVYEEIATRIASGNLPRDGQLPPERTFCEELGVSRATVRRALAVLEDEGRIQAIQGRGTFVTAPRLVEPPNALMSFTQLAADRGIPAGALVLRAEVRPSTLAEADRFRIAPGSAVFDLERLRMLDSMPIAIDHSLVLLSAAPLLPEATWNTASLYELLAEAGSAPARADYDVEATAADALSARRLDVPVGAPLLIADTSSYDRDERLIEIGRIIYRGDRYRFRSTLIAMGSVSPARPLSMN